MPASARPTASKARPYDRSGQPDTAADRKNRARLQELHKRLYAEDGIAPNHRRQEAYKDCRVLFSPELALDDCLIILHLRYWRYCASSCPEAKQKALLDLTPVGAVEKVLAAIEAGKIKAAAKRSKHAAGRGATNTTSTSTSTSMTPPAAPAIAAAPAASPDLGTYIFSFGRGRTNSMDSLPTLTPDVEADAEPSPVLTPPRDAISSSFPAEGAAAVADADVGAVAAAPALYGYAFAPKAEDPSEFDWTQYLNF